MFFEPFDFEGVFDELLAKMQGEDWPTKAHKAFHATPEELGKAAVEMLVENRELRGNLKCGSAV